MVSGGSPGTKCHPHQFLMRHDAPSATGGNGTTLGMQVGCNVMFDCIQRKSSRALCTPLASAMQPLDWVDSAFCMELKIFRNPGRARAIDRSSPRTACQRFKLVQRWDGGEELRILTRQSTRCAGSKIVIPTVSMIHPRTSFNVPHEQSPDLSFLGTPFCVAPDYPRGTEDERHRLQRGEGGVARAVGCQDLTNQRGIAGRHPQNCRRRHWCTPTVGTAWEGRGPVSQGLRSIDVLWPVLVKGCSPQGR